MSGQAHFEVFQGKRHPGSDEPGGPADWRWRLRAANGEIVAQSEGYTTQASAERGAGDAWVAALSVGAAPRMQKGARDVPVLEVVES